MCLVAIINFRSAIKIVVTCIQLMRGVTPDRSHALVVRWAGSERNTKGGWAFSVTFGTLEHLQ
jgi:hypothetical protein